MSVATRMVCAEKNRLALLLGFLLFASVAWSQTYAVFNVPGAVSTDAYSMNDAGTAAGVYADAAGKTHSFVRTSAGQIVAFDVPGATTTAAQSINAGGMVTGYYSDASGTHAFVRSAVGAISSFDIGLSRYTVAYGINRWGTTAGYYSDGTGTHGFVRSASGIVNTFNAPGFGVHLGPQHQ